MAEPLKIVPSIEREIGTASSYQLAGNGWVWDETEENAAWQFPWSVFTCDRMRVDSQISAVMRAIFWPILRAKWHLDPSGCRPEVAQWVSDDLDLPLLGQERPRPLRSAGRFSWHEHAREALLMLIYGFMPFEQLYRIEAQPDGRLLAHLAKLAPRPPITISKINVAADGGLESIEQYRRNQSTGLAEPIPINRLVWYVHEKEAAVWQGRSLLRPAYGDWLIKDRLKRVNAMTIERNGMGIPQVTAAPGSIKADVDAAQAMASKVRAGQDSGIGLPHGMDLKFKGVEGTLPDAIPSMRYHDEAIARSVLAQFLQLGTTHTGSRALGRSFIDFFKMFTDGVAKQIADTASQYIVEDLVDLNWGETEPAPRVVVSQTDIDNDLDAVALQQLFESGALRADDPTEAFLRDKYNLPVADPGSARIALPGPLHDNGTPIAASRRRRTRAAAPAADADAESDPTALPEPLGTLYRRRIQLEQTANATLAEALSEVAGLVDLGHVLDLLGYVAADSTQPVEPDPRVAAAEAAAADALTAAIGDSTLRDTAHTALVHAYAEGQAGAGQLVSVTTGQVGVDLDTLAVDFADAVTAAGNLDELWADADQWIADHIGVVSRAIGDAVAEALAEGTSREDLLTGLLDIIDDADAAEVLYDHALATALDEGAAQLYTDEGVAEVIVMTAGDARVDEICQAFDDHGAYPLPDAPSLPAHVGCRCALAPSDDAIRALLNG